MFNPTDQEFLKRYLLTEYKLIRQLLGGCLEERDHLMYHGCLLTIEKMWEDLCKEKMTVYLREHAN